MASQQEVKLENTDPTSVPNPLGEGKFVKTAGCIIIGDEVLNGKTKDTNSNFFAQYCFDLGIELKRIEVIADDEEEIVEAARRMCKNYDFVISCGGIGPTHDDITYASMGKAFHLPLKHHPETMSRMWTLANEEKRAMMSGASPAEKEARNRMALFPTPEEGASEQEKSEVLFVKPEMWVPVVRLGGKLCIFPGIPKLFHQLLHGLTPYLPLPPASSKPFRHLVFTDKAESAIAPFLTDLQARVKKEGIRVGSYPMLFNGVHVSLIGHDVERIRALGQEVVKELDGKVVAEGQLGAEKETAKI